MSSCRLRRIPSVDIRCHLAAFIALPLKEDRVLLIQSKDIYLFIRIVG